MLNSFFLLLLYIFNSAKAVGLESDVFYAASLEHLMKSDELINRLKSFGVRALILNDVESFEKGLKTIQIEELIETAQEINLKVLIDLRNTLKVNLQPPISKSKSKINDRKVAVSESLTRMKNIARLWLSRNVDGFKVNLQGSDLQLFKSIVKDESKIILTETRERMNPLGANLFYIFQDIITDASCSLPNVGWKVESHVAEKQQNVFNLLKILSAGFVVLDESADLLELQAFLELRKLETFKNGNCEISKRGENFLILKRELTAHESFTVIINMKPQSSIFDLTHIETADVNFKFVVTSSQHSAYNKG